MPTDDVPAVGSTGLFAESISDARRFRLKQALLALANWSEARAGGNHNTETTMTMLEHRIAQIRDQVDRAGWAASNSANNCEYCNGKGALTHHRIVPEFCRKCDGTGKKPTTKEILKRLQLVDDRIGGPWINLAEHQELQDRFKNLAAEYQTIRTALVELRRWVGDGDCSDDAGCVGWQTTAYRDVIAKADAAILSNVKLTASLPEAES